ncbi:MAG: homoserine kinase [Planctomycetota bacterium]
MIRTLASMNRPLAQFAAPFCVSVPASTSNLGPGFDLLGLALSIWIRVTVEEVNEENVISFAKRTGEALKWPEDETNLVVRGMRSSGLRGTGLVLSAHSEIPIARGLGSSGAALVAGLLLGAALSDQPDSRPQQHARGVRIEGHPDNITASLFGGLTLCHPTAGDDAKPLLVQGSVHGDLEFAVAWPDTQLSTEAARAVLPKTVSFSDAIENPRRLTLLLEGLRQCDPQLIRAGLEDRLHERYRLPLIPGAEEALDAAREAGAFGACISGSGSSLVAIGARGTMEPVASAMGLALGDANENAHARVCQIVRDAPEVTAINP